MSLDVARVSPSDEAETQKIAAAVIGDDPVCRAPIDDVDGSIRGIDIDTTVLLNTTNKRVAAAAACLTFLSYIATAVISANEAMHYAHPLWSGLDVFAATVALLAVFAVLGIIGISESAVVALGIFALHLGTLAILTVACGVVVAQDPTTRRRSR